MREVEDDNTAAEDDIPKSYIDIDETYRLALSGRNWQIQRKSIAKTGKQEGKVLYSSFSYHTSLENALTTLLRIKLSKEKFNTLQGLVEANKKVLADINLALNPTYKLVGV